MLYATETGTTSTLVISWGYVYVTKNGGLQNQSFPTKTNNFDEIVAPHLF